MTAVVAEVVRAGAQRPRGAVAGVAVVVWAGRRPGVVHEEVTRRPSPQVPREAAEALLLVVQLHRLLERLRVVRILGQRTRPLPGRAGDHPLVWREGRPHVVVGAVDHAVTILVIESGVAHV